MRKMFYTYSVGLRKEQIRSTKLTRPHQSSWRDLDSDNVRSRIDRLCSSVFFTVRANNAQNSARHV
jgi:hypothetical protein